MCIMMALTLTAAYADSDVEVILNYPDDEFEKQEEKKNYYLKYYIDLDLIYEDERYKKLLKNDNVILKFKYNKEKMSLSGGKLMIGSTEVDKKYFSTQINKQLYNLGEKQIKKCLILLKNILMKEMKKIKSIMIL